jgi:hypothetical protein
MVKLGERELPIHDVKDMDVNSHSSEDEEEELQTTPQEEKGEDTKEEIISEIPQKKKSKRTLSEKQRAALERGRAKKLKMNLQTKMKKIQETSDKLEELPSSPPKLKRTKHVHQKKVKKQPIPQPTVSEASDSEIETDEDIERSNEKDISKLVDKYLESHMKKQANKERKKRSRIEDENEEPDSPDQPFNRFLNFRFL